MTKINEIIEIDNLLIQEILKTKFDEENKFSLITDGVILGLLQSVLDKAKSLNCLIENEVYSGTDTLLRSVFETATYLEFILKEDTKILTEAYSLSSKIKLIKILEQSMTENEIGKTIREMTSMSKDHLQRIYDLTTDKDTVKNRYKVLVGNLNADKWYKLNGSNIDSFQKVCKSLGKEKLAEYEIIYRILSQETHGKEAGDYFKVINGELIMMDVKLDPMVIQLLRGLINNAAKMVAEKYDCMDYFLIQMKPIIDELRNS